MKKRNEKKTSKAGKGMKRVMNRDAQELLLMGSALSESMINLMAQVATTPRGMGAATCALAMAWATLKDVATCEGIEVEELFESELAYYEGTLFE